MAPGILIVKIFFFSCGLFFLFLAWKPQQGVEWDRRFYQWLLSKKGFEADIRITPKTIPLFRIWSLVCCVLSMITAILVRG